MREYLLFIFFIHFIHNAVSGQSAPKTINDNVAYYVSRAPNGDV